MVRDTVSALLVGAACAAVLAFLGWRSDAEVADHLDGLVRELGHAVAETAATSLDTSLRASEALEQELVESMRVKAGFLSGVEPSPELLRRFAVATGLRHLLVFDSAGELVAHARDLPPSLDVESSDQLELSLTRAARGLLRELKDDPVAREWEVPEAGLGLSLVLMRRLPDGGAAILIQPADTFARTRAAGGSERLTARLEQVGKIAYLRFNQTPPAHDAERVLALETPVGERGALRVGIDRSSALRARAVSRKSSALGGAIMALAVAAASFGLLRLRRARDELRHRITQEERLASLGRLAANIAHEVRNPLNAISVAAQRLERGEDDVPGLARVIHEESERLDRTVSDVLRAARPRPPRYAPIRSEVLTETIETLARPEAADRNIDLTVSAEPFTFEGDTDLIAGAAWNLLRNAFAVSREVELVVRTQKKNVEIAVRDRGPGIPESVRDRLFEPFAGAEPGGAGLGLPLALSAAEAHGGTIRARDRLGGGAEFLIVIPLERQA